MPVVPVPLGRRRKLDRPKHHMLFVVCGGINGPVELVPVVLIPSESRLRGWNERQVLIPMLELEG
jgi:hypothetical protein